MALRTKLVAGNAVRIPDPELGVATVVSRYGRERAMLIHPADFHRLNDLDEFLAEVSRVEPPALSSEAVRAHCEEDAPVEPITDPAVLTELFG